MGARQKQGTALFTALLVLIGVGVVVQLWLMTISVDAFFRRDIGTPLHAAIASGVLFVINGLLVLYVFHFDARIQRR